MWFSVVAAAAWRRAFENDRWRERGFLGPHSEMMAITQRNLVFAHVPSMRPIEVLRRGGTTTLRPFEVHGCVYA